MKKWIGIAISIILVLGLAWMAFYWKRPGPVKNKPQTAPTDQPWVMLDFSIIKSVEIDNAKGKVKVEKDENGKWWVVEPKKDKAAMFFLGSFLDELSKLYPRGVIPKSGQEPLAGYGLDQPIATLKFGYADGKTKTLRIGNINPTGEFLYVFIEDEPDVYLVSPRIRMFSQNEPDFYRLRSLLDVTREGVREFIVVVQDPKLRADLDVPEKRHLLLQATPKGNMWILLEPWKENAESTLIGDVLIWAERTNMADNVKDLSKDQMSSWQLDPPRAYFEIIYPDRTEKILVGKEEGELVYLFQEKRMAVLGFKKDKVYGFLGTEYRVKRLLTFKEMNDFDRIEVKFPARKNPGYNLVKMDEKLWAVDGDPQKKFPKGRINWVAKDLLRTEFQGFVTQRPVEMSKYGLQHPAAEIIFYSNNAAVRNFLISKWSKEKDICYVYDTKKDILVGYQKDLVEWIAPDAGTFLVKKVGAKENKQDKPE